MSNWNISSSSSYTSTSYSSSSYSSSSTSGPQSQSQSQSYRSAEQSSTDPVTGTTTRRAAQYNDEPVIAQEVKYPADGSRPSITGFGSHDAASQGIEDGQRQTRSVEDVSDKDNEYEAKIEDEYAKREGGA